MASDFDVQLRGLEARIRRRSRWCGRPAFYQVLNAELEAILASAADPAAVRERVNAMLLKMGHSLEAPKFGGVAGDAAPLCVVPDRG